MLHLAPLPPIRYPHLARQPTEMCMLATRWRGDVPAGGLVAQEKIDGIRAVWIEGDLYTREGTPIEGVDHIRAELRMLERQFGQMMMLDGEFQVEGNLRATTRHFQRRGRDGDAGWLFLFDAVPLLEWRRDTCSSPLTARLTALERVAAGQRPEHVSVLPSRMYASVGTLQAAAEKVWSRGGEGLVAKHPGSLYRRRRASEWLKLKEA